MAGVNSVVSSKGSMVECLRVRHDESARKENMTVSRTSNGFLSLSLIVGRADEVLLCRKVATGPLDLNFQ